MKERLDKLHKEISDAVKERRLRPVKYILCKVDGCNISAEPTDNYYFLHYHSVDEDTVLDLMKRLNNKEEQMTIIKTTFDKL